MLPYRRRMQMIYQDPYASLNPRMTGEIVGEPLIVHQIGAARSGASVPPPCSSGRCVRGDRCLSARISGGQRQRIGIARALALNSRTDRRRRAGVGARRLIQAQITNLLMDLQDEFQLSYLFVAHDLAVVEHISHRVAVMYLGRIVEMTDKTSLLRCRCTLHRSAALGGADPARQRAGAHADHPHGRRAEPDQPAGRLPFPRPLPLRHAALQGRRARTA